MNTSLSSDYRSILKLALPVSAGTFTQFLVILTDNYFLSQVSDAAFNGAGNAGILYITLAMMGQGLASFGQILIARRVGEGRSERALILLRTGMAGLLVIAFGLIVFVELSLHLGFSNVFKDPDTGLVFSEFISIRKWGYAPGFLMLMLNAYFMGIARSRVLMLAMMAVGLVNILGDYILISGRWGIPGLGAEGAAWASFSAECTGVLVMSIALLKAHGKACFELKFLQLEEILHWVKLALPLVLQLVLTLGTWSMFFFLVEQVGMLELKVSHVARNYFMLAFTVTQGVSQTTRTYVSTLLGEGRGEELPSTLKRLFYVNLCGIVLLAHGLLLYPEWFAQPFFDDAAGLEAASKTLPIIFIAMLIYSASSVMLSAIQGSGHTTPALVVEMCAIVFYTLATFTLTVWWPQPVWRIWWVEFAYFSVMAIGCAWFLLRRDWRSKRI
jgi:MATE family multidrug resistance protein